MTDLEIQMRLASQAQHPVVRQTVQREIAEKKMQTAFIGALSCFEKEFGWLWGCGLPEEECSPEQREWRRVWERCRNNVLNVGNNQLRALRAEFNRTQFLED